MDSQQAGHDASGVARASEAGRLPSSAPHGAELSSSANQPATTEQRAQNVHGPDFVPQNASNARVTIPSAYQSSVSNMRCEHCASSQPTPSHRGRPVYEPIQHGGYYEPGNNIVTNADTTVGPSTRFPVPHGGGYVLANNTSMHPYTTAGSSSQRPFPQGQDYELQDNRAAHARTVVASSAQDRSSTTQQTARRDPVPQNTQVPSYQIPGLRYYPIQEYRHRDSLGRLWRGPDEDRYIDANDGRLEKLVVQAANVSWMGRRNGTWERTTMQNKIPLILRVMYWVYKDSLEYRYRHSREPDASNFDEARPLLEWQASQNARRTQPHSDMHSSAPTQISPHFNSNDSGQGASTRPDSSIPPLHGSVALQSGRQNVGMNGQLHHNEAAIPRDMRLDDTSRNPGLLDPGRDMPPPYQDTGEWTLIIKWLPAAVAISILLFIPADLGGEIKNNGLYERFKYIYWGYPKVASNPSENRTGNACHANARAGEVNPTTPRLLKPSTLCFLGEGSEIQVTDVEGWNASHNNEPGPEYIFVAYTAQQFSSNADKDELHRIAQAAAQQAGVSAYWLACSCMPDNMEEEVHKISDVVRGAHSLVIVVGPPQHEPRPDQHSNIGFEDMLAQWGGRLWTFPEVLLSPSDRNILVYQRGTDLSNPRRFSKLDFAREVWHDSPVSRQLVDHYEGSIMLGPLELITIALQCMGGRKTDEYFPGDLSYALMGLLRRRPMADGTDSAFQAFARLSLANDSNRLLERLICLNPRKLDEPWWSLEDAWKRNLWDIEPICQVVGIGEKDTVILSGAFGAPIRWKSFVPVNLMLRNTVKRFVARAVLRLSPLMALMGAIILGTTELAKPDVDTPRGSEINTSASTYALPSVFLGIAGLVFLLSPYLVRSVYVGKTWEAQPWLFGFEGYLDINEIETRIFGANLGRLSWSPFGSELSRQEEILGDCVGVDPVRSDPHVARFVQSAKSAKYTDPKVFTLVDTNTRTVTLFQSVRPPVAAILCGSEGGMQRAVLCSYDWKNQTLYRESVIRVKALVLEKMSRVDRFRLGLRRECETVPAR